MSIRVILTVACLGLAAGLMAPASAEAAACAKGVYRAGCVGPNGAVGVRRAPARAVVVAPAPVTCRWINGVKVCKRW